MIEIFDRISDENKEYRKSTERIFKYGISVVGGALLLASVILGVNFKGSRIPELEDDEDENDSNEEEENEEIY